MTNKTNITVDKRAQRRMAKVLVYQNAAEFIRGHGEEGGLDEDSFDFPLEMYLREAKKLAKKLDKLSLKYDDDAKG